MSSHRKLTQAQLMDEAKQRFGDDPLKWAFECPHCGDVATLGDFQQLGVDPARAGQECIGRHLGALQRPPGTDPAEYASRGCDWVSYGLIRGPWQIVLPEDGSGAERSLWAFPLAQVDEQTEGRS